MRRACGPHSPTEPGTRRAFFKVQGCPHKQFQQA